jgi:hypothetical protein
MLFRQRDHFSRVRGYRRRIVVEFLHHDPGEEQRIGKRVGMV